MDASASFGYWIRRRRNALDLTQSDLAGRVGCAVITIQKIEADARRPSRQIAQRLAEALALPPGDRAAFLHAARAELAPDRLADPLANVNQHPSERAAPDSTAPVRTSTTTFRFFRSCRGKHMFSRPILERYKAMCKNDSAYDLLKKPEELFCST